MNPSVQRMSPGEFAAFQRAQGAQIRAVDDVLWSQVRPLFYRPLLLFQEYTPTSIHVPVAAWAGGCQFAVPSGHPANSHLNLLMFEDAPKYSVGSLDHNRRRQVKLAARQLTIREIVDPAELKEKAHPVYLSFYERTHYGFKAERRDKNKFASWVDDLFRYPGNIILGSYDGSELGGVSVSQLVGDTLLYSTFFCDDRNLKLYAPDLMLHTVREKAAALPGVRQIYAGMYKGGQGLDSFYLLRGCRLVQKPAVLRLNPAASLFLRLCLPSEFPKLRGEIDERGKERRAAHEAPAT